MNEIIEAVNRAAADAEVKAAAAADAGALEALRIEYVGRNGLFITPQFGTLQRFAMLVTDVELPADEIITRNVCENCNACEKACPLDSTRCSKCSTGAVQTDFGRFNTVDKIAAACGRACLASLEARNLIERKLSTAFRKEVK